jgi:hypothetical protein
MYGGDKDAVFVSSPLRPVSGILKYSSLVKVIMWSSLSTCVKKMAISQDRKRNRLSNPLNYFPRP